MDQTNKQSTWSSIRESLGKISAHNPDDYRRGRLLVSLLFITGVLLFLLLAFNVYTWVSGQFTWDKLHFFIDLLGAFCLAGIWYLNRKGHTWLAGVLLVCIFMIRTGLILDPQRFTNFYWMFSLPIIISSFILSPVYSFPSAILASVIYFAVKQYLQIPEDTVMAVMKIIGLFILAGFSYFTARYLEDALDEVKESEKKYHTLFSNLPIGLYRTAPDGSILDINAAFLQMFGFTDVTAAKKNNAASLYADPSTRHHYLTIVEDSQSAEIQMRRVNGEVFWVSDHVNAIRDKKGEVLYYEGSLVDITSRVEAQTNLELLAVTDPLTGMFNRRHFFAEAERIYKASRRNKSDLAVMMIDIDYFKRVNDKFGHAAGDAIICEVAKRLQDSLRSFDLACRYGGDEFTILLARVNPDDIQSLAKRMHETITREIFFHGKQAIKVTASMGIALLSEATTSVDVLFERADKALYAAKHAGRNRWMVWTSNLPDG